MILPSRHGQAFALPPNIFALLFTLHSSLLKARRPPDSFGVPSTTYHLPSTPRQLRGTFFKKWNYSFSKSDFFQIFFRRKCRQGLNSALQSGTIAFTPLDRNMFLYICLSPYSFLQLIKPATMKTTDKNDSISSRMHSPGMLFPMLLTSRNTPRHAENILFLPGNMTPFPVRGLTYLVRMTLILVRRTLRPVRTSLLPVRKTNFPVRTLLRPVRITNFPVRTSLRPVRITIRSIRTLLRPVRITIRPVRISLLPIRITIRPVRTSLRTVRITIRPVRTSLRTVRNTRMEVRIRMIPDRKTVSDAPNPIFPEAFRRIRGP